MKVTHLTISLGKSLLLIKKLASKKLKVELIPISEFQHFAFVKTAL